MALQPGLLQELIDPLSRLEAGFVVKDVEDAAALKIEGNALLLGNPEELASSFQCQPNRFDRVLTIMPDIGDEFAKPRIFVQAGSGVHEERSITREHPPQSLDDRRRVVPYFRVGRRQLAAIRQRRFHPWISMSIENRDLVAAFEQGIGCRHAGNAGADNCDMFHAWSDSMNRLAQWRRLTPRTPHLSRYLRVSSARAKAWSKAPSVGTQGASLQIVLDNAVPFA
jgi:hypothetical protein